MYPTSKSSVQSCGENSDVYAAKCTTPLVVADDDTDTESSFENKTTSAHNPRKKKVAGHRSLRPLSISSDHQTGRHLLDTCPAVRWRHYSVGGETTWASQPAKQGSHLAERQRTTSVRHGPIRRPPPRSGSSKRGKSVPHISLFHFTISW